MKDQTISIFKNLYKSKDVPYIVTLSKIVERIKTGTSKSRVEKIRQCNDKSERNEIKKDLPCILFAGEFNERNSKGLRKHAGLMVVDFDGYPSQEIMLSHLKDLKQNKHFVLLFVSPSGNGIKGVLRVSNKLDKETHPKIFKAFHKAFNYAYFDISNSNIDRVCYESYDPNIYVNYDAELFDEKIIDEGFNFSEKIPTIPLDDELKIIEKIMSFNFKKDFKEGERNNYIFDIAGLFCEYGVHEETASNYIISNISFGDFTDSEVKTTVKSAYRIRSFKTKFFEDYQKINSIKHDLKKGKKRVIEKYKIEEDVYEEIKEAQDHEDFWTITQDKNGNNKIKITPLKYKLFLERNGFKKHYANEATKPTWVFIESNKVSETSVEKIKDFVLDYLADKKEFEVWNYCSSFQNLFSESFLLMLDTVELKILKDEKQKSYIYFNNGVLEVNKNEIKLIDYIDVDGYIWKNQIINRDFKTITNYSNEYQKFINNISRENPKAIEVVIGYLISTYKNKMNNKAIILNDEVISENPEGGTGKGLFVQGLKQIRKVSILDGKSFDDKKSFPYQTVKQETNILVFDDVNNGFNFESKFSLVTEGMTLERKNKDAIKLKVEESPKILISTNYAIKGEGNSHDRRRHEIEFAQYYGKDKTPYDEFGRQLFDDWNADDFLKFDNYMVYCLQSYLKNGLIEQDAINIKLRKFIAETSMDFYEWISDTDNFAFNTRHTINEIFEKFKKQNKDYDNNIFKQKRFTMWVKKYANYMDLKFDSNSTNGKRWLIIENPDFETKDHEDQLPF